MSCIENEIIEASAFEQFIELVDSDCDVEGEIAYAFLTSWEFYMVCKEGAQVWDYTDYDHVFNILWNYDCEGMCHNMKETINRYYENQFKRTKTGEG